MAKKKPEAGLTTQLQSARAKEEKQTAKEAKKAMKHQLAELQKEAKKGIKRLNAAVKAACDRLTHENSTNDGALIMIDVAVGASIVHFDGPFEFAAFPGVHRIEEAAWTRGNLALVPEHQRLAIKVGGNAFGPLHMFVISDLMAPDDSWIFTTSRDLLGNFIEAEQGALLTDYYIDPIVEWLDSLGLPQEKPAKKVKKPKGVKEDSAEPATPEAVEN